MKAEPRAVLDTNVLISAALLADSLPARVLRHVLAHGRLVFSEPTFAELDQRLWRPRFDRYVTIEQRRLLLHDLAAVADWVPAAALDALVPQAQCRDPDDDKFLHAALAGGASVLVSGDRDLLALGRFDHIPILSPAEAWADWTAGRG
jgi:putative PIN family toxin of toxin-antitoxin system